MNNLTRNTGTNDMLNVSKPENVAQMSPGELQNYIEELQQQLVVKENKAFHDAVSAINAIISEKITADGVVDIHTLSEYLKNNHIDTTKVEPVRRQKRKLTHEWVHRENNSLRWAGRGQVIKWLREEMIEKGFDPSDKEAVRSYCEQNLDLKEI